MTRATRWEIVVTLDRATDRGARMLPVNRINEHGAPCGQQTFEEAQLQPETCYRCDHTGAMGLDCLRLMFSFEPEDVFSDAEDTGATRLRARAVDRARLIEYRAHAWLRACARWFRVDAHRFV